MQEPKIGNYDDLLNMAAIELQPIMIKLRELVFELHPETCEVVRLGDKAASFGVGPAKMKESYLYIMPHKSWVNLGFYQGAMLYDHTNILEGTGKQLRHIKIHNLTQISQPEIKELMLQAINLRMK